MTEEHEREEKPFDPERRGTWQGSGRELVVNPNQFYQDLEELIVKRWGRTFTDPEEKLAEAKRILKEGGRHWDVMRELDELLDTHGVEGLPGVEGDISYLNTGETYEPTIMHSADEDKYFISDWGTVVEEHQNTADQDAWDNWIEAEVRSGLEKEFEAHFQDDERSIDRAVTALEELDSSALQSEFGHALADAGGEYVHESDGSVSIYKQDKGIESLAERIIEKMKAVPEQTSFGFNPRRSNGEMGGLGFIARLRDQTGPVRGTIAAGPPSKTGQLFVNFYNIPRRSEPRDRAELENNRMMFTVAGFGDRPNAQPPSGKIKIEQTLSALPREYRLRAKSGTPEQIVEYLADFLNKVSAHVPPKYTHSRAPNARKHRGIVYRVRGTADDHRDREMAFGRSSRTLSVDVATEPEAMRAFEQFKNEQPPVGREAKIWIEKSWPSGDFSVLAKLVGKEGRWVPGFT
jgi:hypothetical protein